MERKSERRIKVESVIRKVGETVKDWVVPVLMFSTVAAAWSGHVTAKRNEKEIRRLSHNEGVMADVINGNADLLGKTMGRVSDLENRNQELFNEALKTTEGKEDPAA